MRGNSFFALLMASSFLIMAGCSLPAIKSAGTARVPAGEPSAPSVSAPPASQGPSSASVAQPQVLTNLSALSPSNPMDALGLGKDVLKAPAPGEAPAEMNPSETTQANLRRLFFEHPESAQYVSPENPPSEEKLLNAKAQQYSAFADSLVHRVLLAAGELERSTLAHRSLPDTIKPVILTAVMSPEGRLTDLIIEQNSGVTVVDQLMAQACKTGLWSNTPPPGALTRDGVYRLRIEGWVKNYQFTVHGTWTFETRVGIAVL
jgi:hypothetical protein